MSASADPRISFFIGLSSTKGVRLHPPHAGALDLPAAGPSFPKGVAPNAALKNGTNKPYNLLYGIFIPFSVKNVNPVWLNGCLRCPSS
jgi:hypothetical protein